MESFYKLKQDDILTTQNLDCCDLSEKDFYPPEDTRYYCSGITSIDGGDNFADYAEYFFSEYEDEMFDC